MLALQASERYEAATKLRPTSHAALYKCDCLLCVLCQRQLPRPDAAVHTQLGSGPERHGACCALCTPCRCQHLPDGSSREVCRFPALAAHKPAGDAVQQFECRLGPGSQAHLGHPGSHPLVQALNNWGLVLQELATMRPPAERAALVALSCEKFRRAIAQRPDFDRACYNLVGCSADCWACVLLASTILTRARVQGAVFYAHACQLQSSVQQHLSSALTQVGS